MAIENKENQVKKAKRKQKNIIYKVIAVILIIIGVFSLSEIINKDNQIFENTQIVEKDENSNISNENEVIEKNEEQENQEQEVHYLSNTERINGYKVIGKIIIDKINLDDFILEKTTDASLNSGLTKFWGPNINEPGNFSITGHNYKIGRSALFSRLNELNIGDTFELQDKTYRKITYKIYNKYIVDPEDTSSIDQNKDGKREVTLITCTKGAQRRIILKARET